MKKTGEVQIDGNFHQFTYERDETFIGLKYNIKDLTTDVTIWRDDEGRWQQNALGKAPLRQDTLYKVIEEILANP